MRGRPFYLYAAGVLAVTLGLAPGLTSNHLFGAWSWVAPLALLGAVAGVLLALIGLGFDVTGRAMGCLRTGRNTLSLARLQMVLWTWLVVSGLMAVAACRAWGLWDGDVSTALRIYIPGDLFAAMGISYFTAAATPAVLAVKAQGPTGSDQASILSQRKGETMLVTGKVVSRPGRSTPRLGDLVQGDEVGSAGVVDFSKVQQLLVTLLLVGLYAAMLIGLFLYGPSAEGSEAAAKAIKAGQTPMPGFSDDFVKLLLLSHGGYLAYKIAPKPDAAGTAGDAAVAGRPPPPDRAAPLTA